FCSVKGFAESRGNTFWGMLLLPQRRVRGAGAPRAGRTQGRGSRAWRGSVVVRAPAARPVLGIRSTTAGAWALAAGRARSVAEGEPRVVSRGALIRRRDRAPQRGQLRSSSRALMGTVRSYSWALSQRNS